MDHTLALSAAKKHLLKKRLRGEHIEPESKGKEWRAPRTPQEQMVCGLMAEVLKVERVGLDDNFFELGGHSLLTTLVSRMREWLGAEVPIRLVFEAATVEELVEKLMEAKAGRPAVRRMERPKEIPLSYAQQRLWFLNRLEGKSGVYNIPLVLWVKGELKREALEAGLRDVVERHESLRTIFVEEGGKARQEILSVEESGFGIGVRKVSAEEVEKEIQMAAGRGFDLSQEIPLRVELWEVGEKEHVVMMVLHHIAGDGWSLGILIREMGEAYEARVDERRPGWEALEVQYGDYTLWQREVLGEQEEEGSVISGQLRYWKERLKGLEEEMELPRDRQRPKVSSYRGGRVKFEVGRQVHEGLVLVGREGHASLFMVLQAGLAALLTRLVGGTDVVVGSPIAGRTDRGLEGLIGFFVNTLVLRTDTSGNPGFKELLKRVRVGDLEAYEHQELPFERLVEEMNPSRSMARHPLFQVMLVLQNKPEGRMRLGGLEISQTASVGGTAKFDLSFGLRERRGAGGEPEGLWGEIEYSTELFDRETVEAIGKWYVRVLEQVGKDTAVRIGEIEILEEAERRQLLEGWNGERREVEEKTIAEIFEEQVERDGGAVAVVYGGEKVSYEELNERAERVAAVLEGEGIGMEDVVGVAMGRSVDMVVSLLGILKTGGAYLPLDLEYPVERLEWMVKDAGPKCVITRGGREQKLPGWVKQIAAGEEGVGVSAGAGSGVRMEAGARRGGRRVKVRCENAAYVLYTSGSTGTPKAVTITHRSIVHLIVWALGTIDREDLRGVLASTSICFDLSAFEIFVPLSCGGTVILVANVLELFNSRWADEVTLLNTVPSLIAKLLEGEAIPRNMRLLCLAGEALRPALVSKLQKKNVSKILNLYGPTEDTTYSTSALMTEADATGNASVIGRPIWNEQVYVLDEGMEMVGVGVKGELYIGGAGLARGYLKRGGLTAERFVANPYGWRGERMYRTGDVVRWRRDGRLEFIGRVDQQVKVRGYRVELGEVETVLEEEEGVEQAVVVVKEDGAGEKRMVGYVVGGAGEERLQGGELKKRLEERLPGYMVPSVIMVLEEMPLTANRKVDRRALPAPEYKGKQWRAPRTPQEEMVCGLMAEVLGVERVGLDDNFFELGGHSLLATQLVSCMREWLGAEVPIRLVFEAATVEELVEMLMGAKTGRPAVRWVERPEEIRFRDLNAEVVLDLAIAREVNGGPTVAPSDVLLTGASGFLGAFLLFELLKHTPVRVRCLVRGSSAEEGWFRILHRLKWFGIWEQSWDRRVSTITGNLSKPLMGLSQEQFEELAGTTDAIYHCGANVNAVFSYEILKPANVLGTQEILRMASIGRLKPVHFISTMSVFAPTNGTEQTAVITEKQLLENWQNLRTGYAQSKWVAEKLIMVAASRGIPASIYRPPFISGFTLTGAGNLDDFLSRFIAASLHVGCVPDIDMEINMLPVDYVARAIVALSTRADVLGRTFNLLNMHSTGLREVSSCLLSLGAPVEMVSYDDWRRQCEAKPAFAPLLALFPANAQRSHSKKGAAARVQIEVLETLSLLKNEGIYCPRITSELLQTYVSYFLEHEYSENRLRNSEVLR